MSAAAAADRGPAAAASPQYRKVDHDGSGSEASRLEPAAALTAEDVAQAFVDLALSRKTTGAVLTVDGGNIAAALR